MVVIDLKTNSKINTKKSGTDMLLHLLWNNHTNVINDLQFGSMSRGNIQYESDQDITFNNCEFNYVSFFCKNIKFNNCVFKKCNFYESFNLSFNSCFGSIDFDGNVIVDGFLEINNCPYLERLDITSTYCTTKVSINNSPHFDYLQSIANKIQEEYKVQQEILNNFKYGYKIVTARVLVKLSFPEDAQIVNLHKDKSRASKAKVESIHILKEFNGEGVTNYDYCICNYKVGEEVIPDRFDNNPREDCGHGIHFCKDIEKLNNYAAIPCTLDKLKECLNENM